MHLEQNCGGGSADVGGTGQGAHAGRGRQGHRHHRPCSRGNGRGADGRHEVADYLRRISGADFHVLPEDQAPAKGSRVFVGPTAFARQQGSHGGQAGAGGVDHPDGRQRSGDHRGSSRAGRSTGLPFSGGRAGSALVESVRGERAAAQDRADRRPQPAGQAGDPVSRHLHAVWARRRAFCGAQPAQPRRRCADRGAVRRRSRLWPALPCSHL